MSSCPGDLLLAQYSRGQLGPAEAAQVRTHLEFCQTCLSMLERAESPVERPPDHTVSVSPSHPPLPDPGDDGSSPAARAAAHYPRIEGYRITGVLGQGGMGIVYRAVQTNLNRVVALKVLPAMVGAASPAAVARFRREATAAARLHHTNIIPIYDFGESRDAYFYAMELITGQPLNVLIQHLSKSDASTAPAHRLAEILYAATSGTVPPPPLGGSDGSHSSDRSGITTSTGRGRFYFQQIARWMADAADALHYAHGQSIIHRDIKPGNLILSTDGRIMMADFGLAKSGEEESMTITGSLLGTVRYLSPEQAMAKRIPVDHRTDIYSLGATLYELLCFQPAFPGTDDKQVLAAIITREPAAPRKIMHAVPSELETICLKCLEKSPEARYATAKALADDLRCYLADMPIVAKRPGLIGRAVKFVRRRKAPVIAVTAGVLLVAVSLVLVQVRRAERVSRVAELFGLGKAAAGSKPPELEEAIRYLERGLTIDTDHTQSLVLLGQLYKDMYNRVPGTTEGASLLSKADAYCQRALSINPNDQSALNTRGVVLKILKRYDESIETYRRVARLAQPDADPTQYASALSNLGACHALKGEFDLARENLTRGAELLGRRVNDPWAAAAWRNLAALELHLNDPASIKRVTQAIECLSNDPESYVLRARLRMSLDSLADPVQALIDATTADNLALGGNGRVKRIRALSHLRNGQWREAAESARRALDLKDLPTANLLILSIAHAKLENLEEARKVFESATTNWPAELAAEGSVLVTADKGILWFESHADLVLLRDEAQRLLPVARD